ncbi:hypothetical protein [Proteiniphilum sp. UBA5384]|uniref:hypothetical protein n=1 Tax=Proteiniphilum sp. UBA5384 TaxID=1947279 RepID=UPI0025F43532|nr:hypothetical protein [Proteiniphilum sp. UBA5384]
MINRVCGLINLHHFERLFIEWSSHMKESGKLDKVIAIDGKSIGVPRILSTVNSPSIWFMPGAWNRTHALAKGKRNRKTTRSPLQFSPLYGKFP